ncbi:MAG: hypothetical protein KGH81_06950 [Thaumarchaeota archaeon]|nr:hypothetical protein [Nitrososphaerota archaeon]
MTNSNVKNNRTKTTTTIIAAVIIGLVLSSPTTIIPNVHAEVGIKIAQPATNSNLNPFNPQDFKYMVKTFPAMLSKTQINKIKQVVMSDVHVKNAIDGQPYTFMGHDFIGNYKINSNVWYPEIHLNVANKTELTVTVDPTISNVTKLGTFSLVSPTTPAIRHAENLNQAGGGSSAKSIDYYTGTQTQIYGIDMVIAGPTYSGDSNNYLRAMLVNGMASGSNENDACTSTASDAFFAQAGLAFVNTSYGPIWSDTYETDGTPGSTEGCFPQAPNLGYKTGDSLVFYILSGSSTWTIYGADSNGTQFFNETPTQSQSSSMVTSDPNTSLFFENYDPNTNWGSEISNPVAGSSWADSTQNWHTWDSETRDDQTCKNVDNYYNYNTSEQVISGGLDNGNTATWDMSRMAQYYPGTTC